MTEEEAAERWADAAVRCRAAEAPCGWCLWRAGYRVPNHLRARRFPGKTREDTMSDESTIGYTEIRVGPEHAREPGHLTPGQVASAVTDIAETWNLGAGDHGVTWWHTNADGVPVGRARTRTLGLTLRGAWVTP